MIISRFEYNIEINSLKNTFGLIVHSLKVVQKNISTSMSSFYLARPKLTRFMIMFERNKLTLFVELFKAVL